MSSILKVISYWLVVLNQKEEERFWQSFRAYAFARLLASVRLGFFPSRSCTVLFYQVLAIRGPLTFPARQQLNYSSFLFHQKLATKN
jgi:hypothetical protein